MSKRNMYTGLMLGAAMLASVSGTAMAATKQTQPQKAVTQESKKEAGSSKTTADKKQDLKATEQNDKEKKDTSLYGTILKIDKEKLELNTATVIWEKTEEKADSKKDDAKKDDAKKDDVKKEAEADFETDTMKWKLDGKTVVVKLDKDTKFLKQASKTADKKAQSIKADDKKDQKTEKVADKKADVKDAVVNMDSEIIKLDDLKEGAIVTIKVKEDGSLVATEVMVLADVKENKTVDAKADAAKADTAKEDATKGTDKKDAGNKTTKPADTAKG